MSNKTTFPETINISEPIILSINAILVIFTLPSLSEKLPATTIKTPVTNEVKLIEILTISGLVPNADCIFGPIFKKTVQTTNKLI